jgi:hypothetical protein
MLLIWLVTSVLATQLQIGYPQRILLTDGGDLCTMTVQIPEGVAKARFLATVVDPLVTPVATILIYAASGSSVTRDASNRLNVPVFGDVDVTVPAPTPGQWTIGVYGNCTVFPVTGSSSCLGSFSSDVSVTFLTELNDALVDMTQQSTYTAYVDVAQGRFGYFSFTLPSASMVSFLVAPLLTSRLDTLHAYITAAGDTPDANDLSAAMQVSLAGSVTTEEVQSGTIQLQAGDYTLGIYAATVVADLLPGQYTRSSRLAVAWALGSTVPTPADPLAGSTCPTTPAPAETGDCECAWYVTPIIVVAQTIRVARSSALRARRHLAVASAASRMTSTTTRSARRSIRVACVR